MKTKIAQSETIETFLPIFNGFYNTLFEPNEDEVIEDPYTFDDYKFNYEDYWTSVAKEACSRIEDKLNELEFKLKIIYERVCSPREYNFVNDTINCKVIINKTNINKILKYLKVNKVRFTEYVKDNFSSYDGFSSFFSTDMDMWFGEYFNERKSVPINTILEFILKNEGYNDENLAEEVFVSGGYLSGELIEISILKIDAIIEYTKDNYIKKDIETITNDIVEDIDTTFKAYTDCEYRFTKNSYNKGPFNINKEFIKDIVIGVFADIEDHTLKLF